MVDLKEAIKAAKGEIRTINMEAATQPVANVSADVKSWARPKMSHLETPRREVRAKRAQKARQSAFG